MKIFKIIVVFIIVFIFVTTNAKAFAENIILEAESVEETQNQIVTEPVEEIILVSAKVLSVGEVYEKEEFGNKLKYQDVEVEILEGKFENRIINVTYGITYDLEGAIENYELEKGNTVEIRITEENGEIKSTSIERLERSSYVYIMLAVFFILILVVGRKQGIKAIVAFLITILAIFYVMLESILNGKNAILMAILVSIGIIVTTFIVIAGFNKKSLTAMIGTSGGVISAALLAILFGVIAKLTGGQEEAIYLSMNTEGLVFNFKDLLFAGIVISSLGACMDVGMSIASSLDELRQKNPEIKPMELFKSGMNIGGDIIGTMTNTLILAYIGGAVNLVLLYMINELSVSQILNIELIATDAISALAASMGVILTVPITAAVYSMLNKPKKIYQTESKTKIDGQRSLKL